MSLTLPLRISGFVLGALVLLSRKFLRYSSEDIELAAGPAVPIPCHSHNDYWRKEPVHSALRAGCVSIEADVWYIDDELYVGHERWDLRGGETFTSLYVDPLMELLEERNARHAGASGGNPVGVFKRNPEQTLVLLVDLKTAPEETWPAVVRQLEPLRQRGWLSSVNNGTVNYGPVTVVGSGTTDFELLMENAVYRDYFFDAPIDQLGGARFDASNSYYASKAFKKAIGYAWFGTLSESQITKIRQQVAEAHVYGLKLRYWGLPAWPISVRNHIWTILVSEGVDVLNVDDVQGAKRAWAARGWPTLEKEKSRHYMYWS